MTAFNAPLPTAQLRMNVPITSPNGSTALLGTTSSLAIAANIARRGIMFFNPGTVTIFVCPANIPAVIGQGIPILPGGGPVQFIGDADNNIAYNSGWNAIATSGSNNPLTILEML